MRERINQIEARLRRSMAAWQNLRPEKSLSGMTLAPYAQRLQKSFEARSQVDRLLNELSIALSARARADEENLRLLNLVVNAIKGDPEEGDDGRLYAAQGCVRKSERRSGLSRCRKNIESAPASAIGVAV